MNLIKRLLNLLSLSHENRDEVVSPSFADVSISLNPVALLTTKLEDGFSIPRIN